MKGRKEGRMKRKEGSGGRRREMVKEKDGGMQGRGETKVRFKVVMSSPPEVTEVTWVDFTYILFLKINVASF